MCGSPLGGRALIAIENLLLFVKQKWESSLTCLSSEYKGALDLDFLPIPQRCSAVLSSHPAFLLFCRSRLQQRLGQSRCSGGVVRDVCVWVLILGSFVRKMPHQNDEAQRQLLEHPLHPFESGQDTVPFFGGALSPVSQCLKHTTQQWGLFSLSSEVLQEPVNNIYHLWHFTSEAHLCSGSRLSIHSWWDQ